MKILRWIVLLAGTTTHAATENPDPVIWAWTCASKGLYEMKVLPDGQYQPFFDDKYRGPIQIRVKRDANKVWDYCATHHDGSTAFSSEYFEIMAKDSEMFSSNGNQCTQLIEWASRVNPVTLKDIEPEWVRVSLGERHKSMLLELMKDDIEWRFILSRNDLTTEKHARELRVHNPNSPVTAEAYASAYFLTGECIIDQQP